MEKVIKNKKGFIAVSIIYSLFFVFLLLMILIMANYTNNRIRLSTYKDDVKMEYSSIDMTGPSCAVTFTSQNANGVSGIISATDEKSNVIKPSSYTFTNLKETVQYSFKDDHENETICSIIVNVSSSHRTRTKTLNECKTTHEECKAGYYDPMSCKGSCKTYNQSCTSYVANETCMNARDSGGICSGGGGQWDCSVDWPTLDGGRRNPCYSGNPSKTSQCYCVQWGKSCSTGSCKEYYYNASCGNTAYSDCLTKENVCDSGYDYGEWSNYINGDCDGLEEDVCEVSSTYTGSLEEFV